MSDSFNTILTVCGLGIGGCISVFLLVLLVLFVTGRWMMIPTVVAIVPQLFRTVIGGGMGLFGGLDLSTDDRQYDDEPANTRTRGNNSPTSASDRIRQRREQFNNDPLSPERRPFQQGGQRGKLSDRYDIRPSKTIHSEGDNRRPNRDDRRREWNEDEIFGGMFEDE